LRFGGKAAEGQWKYNEANFIQFSNKIARLLPHLDLGNRPILAEFNGRILKANLT